MTDNGIIEAFRESTPSSFPKSFIGNPEAFTEGRFLPQLVFVFYAFIVFGLRRRLPF